MKKRKKGREMLEISQKGNNCSLPTQCPTFNYGAYYLIFKLST